MKNLKLLFTTALLFLICISANAQPIANTVVSDPEPQIDPKELKKQLDLLQAAYNEIISGDEFEEEKRIIRSGLTNANKIEGYLKSSNLLITGHLFKGTIQKINNPANTEIGPAFTDVVTDAATRHLIRESTENANGQGNTLSEQTNGERFKSFISMVLKSPVVESILKSNPVTGVMSTVLQQVTAYQRQKNVTIPATLIRALRNDSQPISIPISIEGAPFDETQLANFDNSIKERVTFYESLNSHEAKVNSKILDLMSENQALTITSSTTFQQLLKTLGLPGKDHSNEYEDLLKNSYDRKGKRDKRFNKAVALSENANETIASVIKFNDKVIDLWVIDMTGYKVILEGYIGDEKRELRDKAKLKEVGLKQIVDTINDQIIEFNKYKSTYVAPK